MKIANFWIKSPLTDLLSSCLLNEDTFYHELLLKQLSVNELVRLFVGKIPTSTLSEYPRYIGQIPEDKILELITSK